MAKRVEGGTVTRRVDGGDSDQLLRILPSQRQWTFLEQHRVPNQSVILDGPQRVPHDRGFGEHEAV